MMNTTNKKYDNFEMNKIVIRSHKSLNKSVINFVLNQPDLSSGKNYEMEFNNHKSKEYILVLLEKYYGI